MNYQIKAHLVHTQSELEMFNVLNGLNGRIEETETLPFNNVITPYSRTRVAKRIGEPGCFGISPTQTCCCGYVRKFTLTLY